MRKELDRKLKYFMGLKIPPGNPKFRYLVLEDKHSPRKLVVIKHENGRAGLKIWVDSRPFLVLSKASAQKLAKHLTSEVKSFGAEKGFLDS